MCTPGINLCKRHFDRIYFVQLILVHPQVPLAPGYTQFVHLQGIVDTGTTLLSQRTLNATRESTLGHNLTSQVPLEAAG